MKNSLMNFANFWNQNLLIVLVSITTSFLSISACSAYSISLNPYLPSHTVTPFTLEYVKINADHARQDLIPESKEGLLHTCPCHTANNIGSTGVTTLFSSLTSTQQSAACFAIEGNLELDLSYSFGVVEFIMGPGSSITIGTGVTISISGAYLHGCDAMWEGIRLKTVTSGLWIRNSRIEDAVIAIDNNTFDRPSLIYDNTFNNNYIGIKQGYPSLATYSSLISGNTFTSTSLKYHPVLGALGQIGYCGIYARYANLRVGNTSPLAANTFDNLAMGLDIENSTTVHHTNYYTNINPTAFYPGTGVGILSRNPTILGAIIVGGNTGIPLSYSTFTNVTTGIKTEDGQNFIKHTTMTDVNYGIEGLMTQGALDHVIDSNIITARTLGITYTETSGKDIGRFRVFDNFIYDQPGAALVVWYGIRLSMAGGNSFSPKEVEGNVINTGSNITYGIYLNNIVNMTVERNVVNTTKSSFTGIYALQLDNAEIEDNGVYNPTLNNTSIGYSLNQYINADFRCNLAKTSQTGVYVTSPNTGVDMITNNMESNSSRGLKMTGSATFTPTSGAQIRTGNQWLAPSATPAEHQGAFTQIIASKFETGVNTLPFFAVGYSAPGEVFPNFWFTNIGGTDLTSACNRLDPDTKPPEPEGFEENEIQQRSNPETDWLEMYINGNMVYNLYNEELQSMSNQLVFDFMTSNPGLSYNQNLSDFYNAYIITSSGQLNALYFEKSKSLDYTNQLNQLAEKRDDLLFNLSQESEIAGLLSATPTWDEFEQYQIEVSNLNSQLAEIVNDMQVLDGEIKDLNLIKSQQQLNDLSNISDPSEDQAYYQKQVLEIVLNSDINNHTISNSDLVSLRAIADKCPSQGGRAVSWARTIVTFMDSEAFWNDSLCEEPISNIVKEGNELEYTETKGEFNSYPNPSNGSLEITSPKDFVGRILIINNLGKEIYNQPYVENSKIKLDFESGVYNILWINEHNEKVMSKNHIILK